MNPTPQQLTDSPAEIVPTRWGIDCPYCARYQRPCGRHENAATPQQLAELAIALDAGRITLRNLARRGVTYAQVQRYAEQSPSAWHLAPARSHWIVSRTATVPA